MSAWDNSRWAGVCGILAAVAWMVGDVLPVRSSSSRLAAGVAPAGRRWAIPAVGLVFIGNAWSPLGHAGFYYVAAMCQVLPRVPGEALLAAYLTGQSRVAADIQPVRGGAVACSHETADARA